VCGLGTVPQRHCTEARRAELRRILHQYMPLEEDDGTVTV
jgi:hypothetical protein